jgi:phage shock protein A
MTRHAEGEKLQEKYATATAKVRVWRNRADLARLAGREADANRLGIQGKAARRAARTPIAPVMGGGSRP